jgi:ribonuclease J
MHFKIHRGASEIGGSCVEVWTETTHVVLDFGMPLVNPDKTKFDSSVLGKFSREDLVAQGVLPDIPGLYGAETDKKFALILSHAHQDHYGLAGFIGSNCKFYLGGATHKLIELTNIFTNRSWSITNFAHFHRKEPFSIGDIEITPWLMDHSAFDSYAFLVKSKCKSLFYSGDFRNHGRNSVAFNSLLKNVDKDIDYLLLEGTTIGRSYGKIIRETEIEEKLATLFRSNIGINLIYTSGQNIDRLISIYNACKETGKTMAIDFYLANILKELAFYAEIPFPSKKYPEIRVFYPNRLSRMIRKAKRLDLLFGVKDSKIKREEIIAGAENMVMIVRPTMQSDLELIPNIDSGTFIYSMWDGYLQEEKTMAFVEYLTSRGLKDHYIHTSGHADIETAHLIVDAIKPRNLVPIHTFDGEAYQNLFRNVNVRLVKDKEVVKVE